ncbi:enoyl-CoA hydratase/isomerase family protein [Paenibacillus sp. MWE-103]|uniref:Enoyl-CoA hydratase/isomerase family protein n=1 Tax=Paenibacillus artemisiicola TaxID=1172618 RepID=A0ABS3WAR7_9BACL|nr:enoyl-CoA hydratase-related protein [Paenibacillus artemisiicola]MBO7745377.1 enoyl-CoA hydratase/isomerase family protein [Paenibacillus artemisiicola]
MTAKPVLWEEQGHVGRIVLNRPERLNALNAAMLEELDAIVGAAGRRPREIRVVIVEGAGRAFCAGADLKERLALTEREAILRGVGRIKSVFGALARLPQPTIAAMGGLAFGGGLELALSCDFRIAVRDALLGLTETSLGIIPGAGGTQRLARLIGPARAKELILTARKISAEQALAWGIVNGVAEDGKELRERCAELAGELLASAPLAVMQAKAAIDRGLDADPGTAMAIEAEAYAALIGTKDRVEALEAFRAKRPPRFTGE